jgi:hypothetical protein
VMTDQTILAGKRANLPRLALADLAFEHEVLRAQGSRGPLGVHMGRPKASRDSGSSSISATGA